jgi:hypothetical protein
VVLRKHIVLNKSETVTIAVFEFALFSTRVGAPTPVLQLSELFGKSEYHPGVLREPVVRREGDTTNEDKKCSDEFFFLG